ncbi:hypothetical protein HAX54_009197 [Datura stramonium]|uniref:Uncharacterized protein n=1 Tax=Datura stramonium TaxID=4076 RepID=A0ABS8RJR4_DATST|nr:hypothetical protein [Datura stramonium]
MRSSTSQNSELKFRLQAMEQQAQLRDALNEALTAEVQRLKIATAELSADASKFQQSSQSSDVPVAATAIQSAKHASVATAAIISGTTTRQLCIFKA